MWWLCIFQFLYYIIFIYYEIYLVIRFSYFNSLIKFSYFILFFSLFFSWKSEFFSFIEIFVFFSPRCVIFRSFNSLFILYNFFYENCVWKLFTQILSFLNFQGLFCDFCLAFLFLFFIVRWFHSVFFFLPFYYCNL